MYSYVSISISISISIPISIYIYHWQSPSTYPYHDSPINNRARYFSVIKVSTRTASIPLSSTSTDFATTFKTATIADPAY